MSLGSGISGAQSAKAHPPHVSLLSQPGTGPGIRPVIRRAPGWRTGADAPAFLRPFGPPAFASWASYCQPARDARLTRHQQGFRVIHPSGLPLACGTRSEQAPLGFPLSFAPSRYQPRTSGRGRVWNTNPKSRLRHQAGPPIDELTHNVRPRVAPHSHAVFARDCYVSGSPRLASQVANWRGVRTPSSMTAARCPGHRPDPDRLAAGATHL